MSMTKEVFKKRWESSDWGGGITYEDVADCAKEWGLFRTPRTEEMDKVLYVVLKAAGTADAEEFNPEVSE